MAVKAATILKNIQKQESEDIKSTLVHKDIDAEFDTGNLTAIDGNPLDDDKLNSTKSEYLKSLTRDNTQLLFNEIWQLPIERVQDTVVAKLSAPTLVLPREKSIPKAQPKTKWEEYARLKGVKNRKKSRMVWDEPSQSWKPRWGYKRANDNTKEWVLEVPKNADPNEDQFEKRLKAKKDRVAKNELQRLRNVARRSGKKVPGVGTTALPGAKSSNDQLDTAFNLAKKSTASVGRFEGNLKNESIIKREGKKRKFQPLIGNKNEKSQQLEILNQLFKKSPKIDINKAVNKENKTQNTSKSSEKKGSKKGASKGKGGKKSVFTRGRRGKRKN